MAKWKCEIKRHHDTVHESHKAFSCTHCHYVTARRDHLKKHMDRLHKATNSLPVPNILQ